MAHNVFCVKLKREMPGLDEPPFDNELGQKIYDNVSQEAWRQWMEHCKMLLNEYRLNPARREDQEVIVKQLEMFFFGEGSAKPKEYVAPERVGNRASPARSGRYPCVFSPPFSRHPAASSRTCSRRRRWSRIACRGAGSSPECHPGMSGGNPRCAALRCKS